MVALAPDMEARARDIRSERDEGSLSSDNQAKLDRIYEAIREANRKLRHYRTFRNELVRQYAAHYYLTEEAREKHYVNPVNLIRMTANIYTRHLAANNPRAHIVAKDVTLWPEAVDLEAALNRIIVEMDLRETISACTLDSMFCCGIAVVGTETTNKEVLVDGKWEAISNTMVDWIDLDDWVQDMSVRRWKDCTFFGHKFRRILKAAKEDESYRKRARSGLKATERRNINEDGDEKVEAASVGNESPEMMIYDEVELYHLYFPKENKVLIIPTEQSQGGEDTLLASYPWEGPPMGPYHRLSMQEVPGNIMPASPLSGIADLHYLQNNLWRKMGNQARRAKKIGVVGGKNPEEGKRVLEIPDGEAVFVQRPEAAREMQLGGIHESTLVFSLQVQNMFSWMGGNINNLGGLSPQSETLGQDRLLSASASKMVAEMGDRVVRFTRGILESVVWWEMRDDFREIETTKRIPNTTIDIPVTVRPSRMLPHAAKFQLEIHPYSMQDRSPEQRLQALLQYFQFVVMPNIEPMAQQGIQVEFEKVFRLIARQADLPEMDHILRYTGSQPEAQPNGRTGTGFSPAIKRTETVRTNRPGTTQEAQNAAVAGALKGGMQKSQSDASSRAVS